MPHTHRDPTYDKILDDTIKKRGPSICKKNLRRIPEHPLECACKKGLTWPQCRWQSAACRNFGFEIIDD